jgi:hypothetical protein
MQSTLLLRLYPDPGHRGRASLTFKQTTNLANAVGAPVYGQVICRVGWIDADEVAGSLVSRLSSRSDQLVDKRSGPGRLL